RGITKIPILDMLSSTTDELNSRAEAIIKDLKELPLSACTGKGESRIGGGTMPKSTIPSVTIDLKPEKFSTSKLAKNLRCNTNPVMGYTADGLFKIDLRTVFPRQDENLLEAIKEAVS
ncbi:MAG: hypothetical protein OSB44_12070, partial [Verrucomicrobiales bacterium]|nr:hypothetical protein [Verrucomicrobiales bacterium]